jgi:hypothetical protein
MHVRLARKLAQLGFRSLRVDLSGKGDSAPSPGLHPHQATANDYQQISQLLDTRLGPVKHIVGGLCSAADDALRITPENEQIVGLLLLDPVCERDSGFRMRQLLQKYTNPNRYVAWLRQKRDAIGSNSSKGPKRVDGRSLRDSPGQAEMRTAFESIRNRNGRVLSVFTSYANIYYNQAGQLQRVLGVEGYRKFCAEICWPAAEHTFTLESHMELLLDVVSTWATGFVGRDELGAAADRDTRKAPRAGLSADESNRKPDWVRAR